ncbi:MAG: hypothetical protein J2P15_02315 [Micromonosporaceae bacterium]|nr:hypothetical protein [Micromonosporaceae bacterium]
MNPRQWWRWAGGLAGRVAWSARYRLAKRRFKSTRQTQVLYPQYDAYGRPRRRLLVAVTLGLAVAAATVGVYLASAAIPISSP